MNPTGAKDTFGLIKEVEDGFQLATYKKMPIAVERGQGSWVWTSDGEKYLDLIHCYISRKAR